MEMYDSGKVHEEGRCIFSPYSWKDFINRRDNGVNPVYHIAYAIFLYIIRYRTISPPYVPMYEPPDVRLQFDPAPQLLMLVEASLEESFNQNGAKGNNLRLRNTNHYTSNLSTPTQKSIS